MIRTLHEQTHLLHTEEGRVWLEITSFFKYPFHKFEDFQLWWWYIPCEVLFFFFVRVVRRMMKRFFANKIHHFITITINFFMRGEREKRTRKRFSTKVIYTRYHHKPQNLDSFQRTLEALKNLDSDDTSCSKIQFLIFYIHIKSFQKEFCLNWRKFRNF